MGCEWITRDGRTQRVGPVGRPVKAESILMRAVIWIMAKLGLEFVSASPTLSLEDLKDATLRLWLDPEKGYMMEARLTPGAVPIYHSITKLEATAFEAGAPTGEFLARMFHPAEIPDN